MITSDLFSTISMYHARSKIQENVPSYSAQCIYSSSPPKRIIMREETTHHMISRPLNIHCEYDLIRPVSVLLRSIPSCPLKFNTSVTLASVIYISVHLLPPAGSLGFEDFSISATTRSKAKLTLSLTLALASVKLHLNSSASFWPSSMRTCLWSGLRSFLLPTTTKGTHSVPC